MFGLDHNQAWGIFFGFSAVACLLFNRSRKKFFYAMMLGYLALRLLLG